MNFTQEILKRSREIRAEFRRRRELNKKLETLIDPTFLSRASDLEAWPFSIDGFRHPPLPAIDPAYRQKVHGDAGFPAQDRVFCAPATGYAYMNKPKPRVVIGGSAAQ